MTRHPEYQIIEVDIKNGIRSEEVVSKNLMFKYDAQKATDWKNRNDATFIDDANAHYWRIRKNERAF